MNNQQGTTQASPDCRNRQIPATDTVRKHRAGALVRSNLAPLMGRRDAVLDAAETLINAAGNIPDAKRRTLFNYLNELFAAADMNTGRLSGMFNNQASGWSPVRHHRHLPLHR